MGSALCGFAVGSAFGKVVLRNGTEAVPYSAVGKYKRGKKNAERWGRSACWVLEFPLFVEADGEEPAVCIGQHDRDKDQQE